MISFIVRHAYVTAPYMLSSVLPMLSYNGCHDLFQGIISFLSEPYMISFIARNVFLQRLTYFSVFGMHSFIAKHAFLIKAQDIFRTVHDMLF
jgi:hypothetical protein